MVIHHRIKESTYSLSKDYPKLLGNSWTSALATPLLTGKYMNNLAHYIDEVYKASDFIYPKNQDDIFKAFKLTKADEIRVVLFGDEPVPSGFSNGLAFGAYRAVQNVEVNSTRQSRNIARCLDPEGIKKFEEFDTTLLTWAEQKILLLNTSLISQYSETMKHEYVFRNFIREVITKVSDSSMEVVFVFTSKHQAEQFEKYIDTSFHTILHYDGIDVDSSMFEDINRVLEENHIDSKPIEW